MTGARIPLRSRLEAALLAAGQDVDHRLVGEEKQAMIGALRGTVVEIGPGPGTNMRYYAPGVRVVAIEPNPAMHPRLRAAATAHGVDLDLRATRGEAMDVPDGGADAVVGTLVLCGVGDQAAVLDEVRRVLRRGGTYVFYEHVAAPAGTPTRRLQRLVKGPHRWLLNGCEVDRDTQRAIEAAGFTELDVRRADAPWTVAAWTWPRIIGRAVR